MTIEDLKQPYEPEGVYAGMTQAEALRYLAKRYLRKPECVALCNEVANNLPKLLKVVEAAQALVSGYSVDRGFPAITQGEFQNLLEALEELNYD